MKNCGLGVFRKTKVKMQVLDGTLCYFAFLYMHDLTCMRTYE